MTVVTPLLAPAIGGPVPHPCEAATGSFVTRDFRCTAENLAAVRRYVTSVLTRVLAGTDGGTGETLSEADRDRVFRAVLCASELATNSYDHSASGHGNGTVTVSILLARTVLRVEVMDAGSDSIPHIKPGVTDPAQAAMVENGRGLVLVDGIADHCGTYADEAGRTTWIEISREARR